jgi:1-phosphatidylinositol-3-phosphate 5-kinase
VNQYQAWYLIHQLRKSCFILKYFPRQAKQKGLGDFVRLNRKSPLLKKKTNVLCIAFKGGSTSFTCKIYYAEQFDMFRKSCGCGETFISSLARCSVWDTAGGKSGSTFLKTKGK